MQQVWACVITYKKNKSKEKNLRYMDVQRHLRLSDFWGVRHSGCKGQEEARKSFNYHLSSME